MTPLDAAFTKPVAAEHLGGMLAEKGIEVVSEFATGTVDGAEGEIVSWDERRVPFDLLVAIPVHGGAGFLARSPGLGDELGFVVTDQNTLRSEAAANVFAIGDAANLPTSKAGSATHYEGETLVANVLHTLAGEELEGGYDGHVNCFIESGFDKALLLDFDYDREPMPGRYPLRSVGPLSLLGESRLNHLAKLAFEPIYWHVLLPGHDIPGLGGPGVDEPASNDPGEKVSYRMSTATYAGAEVDLDAEGFMTDADQWNREVGAAIAAENGIPELNDRHWQVVDFMRDTYLSTGNAPSVRALGKASGVPIKELYQLFPKGPAKLAARIAGIPKPRGCI